MDKNDKNPIKTKMGITKGFYKSINNELKRNKDDSINLLSPKNWVIFGLGYLGLKKVGEETGLIKEEPKTTTDKLYSTVFSNPLKKAALIGMSFLLYKSCGPDMRAAKDKVLETFRNNGQTTISQSYKAVRKPSDSQLEKFVQTYHR